MENVSVEFAPPTAKPVVYVLQTGQVVVASGQQRGADDPWIVMTEAVSIMPESSGRGGLTFAPLSQLGKLDHPVWVRSSSVAYAYAASPEIESAYAEAAQSIRAQSSGLILPQMKVGRG